MGSIIRHSPVECYTEWPLSAFDEIGEILHHVALSPMVAIAERKAILLYGPTGNGKSSCVGALHKILADQKILVNFVDCAEWPEEFEDRRELIEDLKSPSTHILILDDLGKEPKQCHKDVGKVIMARSKLKNRLDFITCNLNVNTENEKLCELTEVYSSAVRSRLFGMCRKNVIELNGPDHRLEVD